MLVSLGMLVFTFTATHGTDCARAAGGSCAVGDTEVISNDLGIGGNIEFEGTSVDDFETKITATNPTADRTITLPDASGTLAFASVGALPVADGGTGQATLAADGVLIGNGTGGITVTAAGNAGEVLTSNGAGSDPTYQPGPSGGLSRVETWRLVNDYGIFTAWGGSHGDPIDVVEGNWWELNDTAGVGSINPGMAVDTTTGAFAFPETGIWEITVMFQCHGSYFCVTAIDSTKDFSTGPTWTRQSELYLGYFTGAGAEQTSHPHTFIFDVEVLADDKIRFGAAYQTVAGSDDLHGHTDINISHAVFKKLGDT